MTERGTEAEATGPTLDIHHPIIQSVARERTRHNAELRAVQLQIDKLETEQDQLWVENEQLKTLLNHLPDDNSLDEYVARIGDLEKQNDALEDKIYKLQGLSSDAAKGFRAEYIPTHPRNSMELEELSLEYRDFVDQIINLIYEWVSPLLADDKHAVEVVQAALRDETAKDFITWMEAYPDIARLSSFYLSTEYVCLAVIMRWLETAVFSTEVCGVAPETSNTLEHVEDSLSHHVNPLPRHIEVRKWRQNTNYALMQHPEYRLTRLDHEETLAAALQYLFRFLPGVNTEGMLERICDTIVVPAIEINDIFATSVDHFELHSWNFLPGTSVTETVSTEELYEHREWFELEDPLDNTNKIDIEGKSLEETTRRLDPVCSVIPAIVMRNAEDRENVTLCAKAYVVAAWGLPKTRERKWNEQESGFLNGLLSE